MLTHTIAAIATALSNSGISIIRISGKDSLNIINKIFKTSYKIEPNHIVYGKIMKDHEVLDHVLVSYFKSPKSYTGEDVCEINCHGGNEITKEILELVLESGAILAEPGEFSKRAFLNGKMDLSQAEAVINLINAKTKTESRIASKNMEGNLSKKVRELREELIELLAHIEVSVDYPEYDYDEVKNRNVIHLIDKKRDEINDILKTYEHGRIIKEGVNVAILGKPNVGKSSLLNKLANYNKAIVTDIPGTTRDIVEETINIDDIVFNISDTAGIRDTNDIIEKIGVEKSLSMLDEVDFVIYMLNAEEKIDKDDIEILSKIQNKGIKYITVINKMDKIKKSNFDAILNELKQIGVEETIEISIQEDRGIDKLKNAIVKIFHQNDFDFEHELIITNSRHKDLLKKALNYLEEARNEINNGQPIDIVSIYIKKVANTLGEIIGSNVSQDIIDKIFEKFCVGK
ncbi:MAG: tRNA uridine-5-carboxymethylaminomethyl(34) synthesis GTPase MnmE [Clostridia bacterium]|nr:tRNA uridine-5-carboxymethylaminomethyl(34) synthesis GTPase MnmE [Clostridia bacterium]